MVIKYQGKIIWYMMMKYFAPIDRKEIDTFLKRETKNSSFSNVWAANAISFFNNHISKVLIHLTFKCFRQRAVKTYTALFFFPPLHWNLDIHGRIILRWRKKGYEKRNLKRELLCTSDGAFFVDEKEELSISFFSF